ncbi:MAG: peptide-methionine (S)-S-oxide reductase MsrA [Bacteroidetes bacterium]|nr:peptide-methionine (S)-S-oxide reductase MsrA [Bacteroidota bacterium]MBK9412829.1 peptide-methionine (S)-S-oxide reductase MsrA [Bacteroidota bacterium]MBL0032436.1 peptide-methionine (S)-S-oxide reductase MsrA [Bacteroidota bacterium]MBP6425951.1 peptide-methionine (S)-S-oxide reductase MsrA [Bacteroidia bacterium]MBP6656733.1 peptide-methionine (S)-S-oxide reductase MsrA [Bacteroidia bacterium]
MSLSACGQTKKNQPIPIAMTDTKATNIDTATVGGGCFWCTEAQFQILDGVISVQSGFSGGTIKNPSYREVCMGITGHAEVVQVAYDRTKLNYADVLKAFFESHDPTQLNRQGNDVGTQYRSVIFYHSPEQKKVAEEIKAELDKSGAYSSKVVTEISPYTVFYKADDSHQNYFNENKEASYCQFVIAPKLEKFKKVFKGKLKGAEH